MYSTDRETLSGAYTRINIISIDVKVNDSAGHCTPILLIRQEGESWVWDLPVESAAYDAWAEDMLLEDLFPVDDPSALRDCTMAVGDNGIILLCARKIASRYLTSMLDVVGGRAREHLRRAALLHAKESDTFSATHDIMLWGNVHGDELAKRARRENRQRLAEVILACKGHFCRAMDEIRLALQAEGVDVR